MLKLTGILFFIVIATYTLSPDKCRAEQFAVDGYNITIKWKQSGKKMSIWGNVERGRNCKQLNLSVFLQNSKDPGLAHFEAAIKNYRSSGRNSYEAYDTVYQNIHDRKNWHVDQIYANCL